MLLVNEFILRNSIVCLPTLSHVSFTLAGSHAQCPVAVSVSTAAVCRHCQSCQVQQRCFLGVHVSATQIVTSFHIKYRTRICHYYNVQSLSLYSQGNMRLLSKTLHENEVCTFSHAVCMHIHVLYMYCIHVSKQSCMSNWRQCVHAHI